MNFGVLKDKQRLKVSHVPMSVVQTVIYLICKRAVSAVFAEPEEGNVSELVVFLMFVVCGDVLNLLDYSLISPSLHGEMVVDVRSVLLH